MTRAFRCETCDSDPVWRITRRGDAAVSWACDDDLSTVLHRMRRDWEVTELVVVNQAQLAERSRRREAEGQVPAHAEVRQPTRRLKACVENWPDCHEGAHDPRCCRWPKSCSATVYDPNLVTDDHLEPTR